LMVAVSVVMLAVTPFLQPHHHKARARAGRASGEVASVGLQRL